jgi:hypothetical protein
MRYDSSVMSGIFSQVGGHVGWTAWIRVGVTRCENYSSFFILHGCHFFFLLFFFFSMGEQQLFTYPMVCLVF